MVAHYTVAKKLALKTHIHRRKAGKRPDQGSNRVLQQLREIFGQIPIVIGGLEASLRRFAHYDYWQNEVRRSVLVDSSADILSYGMGERSMREICRRLSSGEPVESICDIAGTCVMTKEIPEGAVVCPSLSR